MEKYSTKSQIPNSLEGEDNNAEYYSKAIQLVTSASVPMVLYNAVKLKQFEIIAKAGHGQKLSSAQIASQLSAKNPDAASMLDRMLLLLSNSLFTYDLLEVASGHNGNTVRYERVYGLSPVGEFFVPDEQGNTIGQLAEILQEKVNIDSWYEFGNAVVEGGMPFHRANGMSQFEYAGKDEKFNEQFNKGLVGLTSTTMKQLLQFYKGFEGLHSLVDVGGGHGISLHRITSKYPQINK